MICCSSDQGSDYVFVGPQPCGEQDDFSREDNPSPSNVASVSTLSLLYSTFIQAHQQVRDWVRRSFKLMLRGGGQGDRQTDREDSGVEQFAKI